MSFKGSINSYFERMNQIHWKNEIERKISDLENYVFKTAKKSTTTKAQQILILQELGLLDIIIKLEITTKNKAKLLSILLNSSEENIKKDLQQINTKDPQLKNSINYQFLLDTFISCGLKDKSKSVELELNSILKKEEVKRKKK